MGKLYFREHEDESCYNEKALKIMMKKFGCKQQKVFEAKRMTHHDYFFCKEFGEIGEVGESCGSVCPKYIPNNGKNGRCKHYGYLYEKTEKSKIIKL